MALRTLRERVIQTLSYEIGALTVVAPAYAILSGSGAGESVALLVTLSIAVMIWSPIHNTLFDVIEHRMSGSVASRRSHQWRVVHAISHEATVVVVTLPLIMLLVGYDFWHAIAVDMGLTAAYTLYAYLFHVAFDSLRPVVPAEPLLCRSSHDRELAGR